MKAKLCITGAVAALALVFGGVSAQACNPLLNKAKAPTKLPSDMLAQNHPGYQTQDSKKPIVGLWHVVHTDSEGNLFFEAFDRWDSDGGETELGNFPPATGDICLGSWKMAGHSVDLQTHVAFGYDMDGNYQGTLNMTESNVVNGNAYTGTFDAKFYDPNGNLVDEVTGTQAADRLVSN